MAYGDAEAPDDGSNDGSSGGDPIGSPSGDHPDNDPGNNPGVSTGIDSSSGQLDSQGGFGASTDHGNSEEADANRDAMRGWDSSPSRSHGTGSPTGSHPDQDPTNNPGVSTNQNAVEAEDTDSRGLYGAYDSTHIGKRMAAIHEAQNKTKDFRTLSATIDTQESMNLSTQQLGQNVTVGYGPQRQAQMDDIDAMMDARATQESFDAETRARTSTALGTMEQDTAIGQSAQTTGATLDDNFDADLANTTGATAPVQGYVDPETTTLEAIAQKEYEQRQALANTISLDTETTTTTAPTAAQIEEARQKHRAIEARHWGKTALDAKTAWGVLDAKMKETKTKNFFGLEIEVPKMSKYDKEKALRDFRQRYGKQIEAYNKHYNYQAKQSTPTPGLMNMPAMLAGLINPILGIAVRVGQQYGYQTSPMEQAIQAAEMDVGIRDRDRGEGPIKWPPKNLDSGSAS